MGSGSACTERTATWRSFPSRPGSEPCRGRGRTTVRPGSRVSVTTRNVKTSQGDGHRDRGMAVRLAGFERRRRDTWQAIVRFGPLRAPAPIAVLAALALAACGDEADARAAAAPAATPGSDVTTAVTAAAPATTPEPSREAAAGTRLRAIRSQFGRIVGDGRGLAVYIFDKERRGRSECYAACAKAWPPVLAKGRPVAGAGIDPELLATTRRRN